jgi:hypothetical protein
MNAEEADKANCIIILPLSTLSTPSKSKRKLIRIRLLTANYAGVVKETRKHKFLCLGLEKLRVLSVLRGSKVMFLSSL